jgi:hypothetical protein
MNLINTRMKRESGGVRTQVVPKGYPSIGAPGALYAVDFIHHSAKRALLPACGGQTALRSYER